MRASLLGSALCCLVACSSETSTGVVAPGVDGGPTDAGQIVSDAGACGATIQFIAAEPEAKHVPVGTPIVYPTNPPSGGNHYPIWVTWGPHGTALPAGHWVHNLEHGGVAFLYKCASRAACPDVAAKLEALAASLPQDPKCASEAPPIRARILVIPDPDLPDGVQIAAAAWGWTLTARCFDEAYLRQFYLDHFGRAPAEDLCAQGFVDDPSDAGADASTDSGGDATPDAPDGG